jgi:transglutaminase-like putative cysteine protease
MRILYGFDIELSAPQSTCFVTLMDVHPSLRSRVVSESVLHTNQPVPVEMFVDVFGNQSRRLIAHAGSLRMRLDGLFQDDGLPDEVDWTADRTPMGQLPVEVLPFLTGSRYCETDLLSTFAWSNFGQIVGGWATVQAVCDFVNGRLAFSYPDARPTRTAAEAMEERTGVCRDFTHLAITLCRALNIPARYCNGYLGDIGVTPDPAPMDFNAWFEVYLTGRWFTFDARHNQPRIGRILLSRGRDAADVAMITSFGPHHLTKFEVTTEEVRPEEGLTAAA